jgi:hypothetical protein
MDIFLVKIQHSQISFANTNKEQKVKVAATSSKHNLTLEIQNLDK